MKIWYDITNTPQVHFLLAIDKLIKNIEPSVESIYTAREFSETSKMLEQRVGKGAYITIGGHYGKSYWRKILGLAQRFMSVYRLPFAFDVSISCGSESAVWSAWLKRKVSIAFGDNDQARQWTYGHQVDYAFFPDAIPADVLEKQGLKGKLYRYHGYKEDLYLADYKPNEKFTDMLPFEVEADGKKHYVVVRPENVQANYIRNGNVQPITPDLLRELAARGYSILYLPRYATDRAFADGLAHVFMPDGPINGLDACYYADAVLTGAGTFAREAACLGVPSFSFFAGKELLAVDKQMIANGEMFFSRDVKAIMERLERTEKREPNLARCKATQREVGEKLKEILGKIKA